MPPWSPSTPGPDPGPDSAPAPATPGAGFLPRLDYYLKLAEGPVLPDETSPNTEGSVNERIPDTPMVDPQLEPAIHADEQPDDHPELLIGAASNRHGRIHVLPDGRTTFYGSTSLLNMYPSSPSSWSAEKPTLVPREPLLPPHHNLIELHLMDEYFHFDNFFLPRFTKQLYLLEKEKHESGGDSQLYSPALGHAILAIGALHAHEVNILDAVELSDSHAAKAEAYLTQELQSPRISSVLALMAVCSLSAAKCQDSQGWLDSGTASRLIQQLGLDQQTEFSPPIDDFSPADVTDGVQALDTAWRNWTGRLPDDDWIPSLHLAERDTRFLHGNRTAYTNLMLIQRGILGQMKNGPNVQEVQAVHRIQTSCVQWNQASLQRSSSSLSEKVERPMLIQSRMHYHFITTQLHTISPLPEHCVWANSDSSPCERCVEAAEQIDRMTQEFRKTYGLQKLNPLSIHAILFAGLTAVFACHGRGQTRQQQQAIWRWMQAFVEVAERMSVGQRAMEVLMTAQRQGPPKF